MRSKAQPECGSRLAWLLLFGALGLLIVLTGVDGMTSAFGQTPPGQPPYVINIPDKLQFAEKKGIIDLLGRGYTFCLLSLMIALMGGVYYFFMHMGRRLQETGYLGPLARDAIANAEIARLEKGLRNKLARGDLPPAHEPSRCRSAVRRLETQLKTGPRDR